MPDSGDRIQDAGFRMQATPAHARTPVSRARIRDALIVAIAIALFLALSLKNITLPGLYYDEALDVVPTMQILHGDARGCGARGRAGDRRPHVPPHGHGLRGDGEHLPGAAALRASGRQRASVRLLAHPAGGAQPGARLPAGAAPLRLARGGHRHAAGGRVDPSYVFFSRMGIHVTSVMTVFALGSLLAFLRWRGQRAQALAGAGRAAAGPRPVGKGAVSVVDRGPGRGVGLSRLLGVERAMRHPLAQTAGQHARPTLVVLLASWLARRRCGCTT